VTDKELNRNERAACVPEIVKAHAKHTGSCRRPHPRSAPKFERRSCAKANDDAARNGLLSSRSRASPEPQRRATKTYSRLLSSNGSPAKPP
jgi:hypothetical protein